MPNGRAISTFERGLDVATDAAAWLARVLLMFQVVSITIGVILRYGADISLSWLNSANEWSLLWVAFLGAPWLEREGGHVNVDTFVSLAGDTSVWLSRWIGLLVGLGCCAVLLWFGVEVAHDKFVSQVYDFFKIRNIPVYPIYTVIPFGCLLWLLQIARKMKSGSLRQPPPDLSL